jgi:hypothetical protein
LSAPRRLFHYGVFIPSSRMLHPSPSAVLDLASSTWCVLRIRLSTPENVNFDQFGHHSARLAWLCCYITFDVNLDIMLRKVLQRMQAPLWDCKKQDSRQEFEFKRLTTWDLSMDPFKQTAGPDDVEPALWAETPQTCTRLLSQAQNWVMVQVGNAPKGATEGPRRQTARFCKADFAAADLRSSHLPVHRMAPSALRVDPSPFRL